MGRSLVSIKNQRENSIIKEIIKRTWGSFWIGLNDRSVEGNFEWIDGSVNDYRDWAAEEPNNAYNQDCVQLWRQKNYKWDDDRCVAAKRYICGPGKLHFQKKFK